MNYLELLSKVEGAIFGVAIGDALGATNEFKTKEQIERVGKVTEIIGGGWLNLEPGEITDDTQMTLQKQCIWLTNLSIQKERKLS